jgi:hypothetical protein
MGVTKEEAAGQLVVLLVEGSTGDEDADLHINSASGTTKLSCGDKSGVCGRVALASGGHRKSLIISRLAVSPPARAASALCLPPVGALGGHSMFALSAVLIGVVGIFWVRKRSQRKKQTA